MKCPFKSIFNTLNVSTVTYLVSYYDIITSSQVLFIEKPPVMPLIEALPSNHI